MLIGGKIKMLNYINLWVKIMYLFILLSFLPHLLPANKIGPFFIISPPLNILIMKEESSVKLMALEFLAIMQLTLKKIFLVRFGDTIWSWIGLRLVIHNFAGKTLLRKIITNFWLILAILFTGLFNLSSKNIIKKYQK